MILAIRIVLDPDQHTPEQAEYMLSEIAFAAEGAVGVLKMDRRPRRDFEFEIEKEIISS